MNTQKGKKKPIEWTDSNRINTKNNGLMQLFLAIHNVGLVCSCFYQAIQINVCYSSMNYRKHNKEQCFLVAICRLLISEQYGQMLLRGSDNMHSFHQIHSLYKVDTMKGWDLFFASLRTHAACDLSEKSHRWHIAFEHTLLRAPCTSRHSPCLQLRNYTTKTADLWRLTPTQRTKGGCAI